MRKRTKVFHEMSDLNDHIEAYSKRGYRVEVRTQILKDGKLIHKVTVKK